ncbi:MAG: hypothetical protein MUF04_11070, partial [Akkermansiaceae bacterium]|nr:hypothetical protein [Akkermansiaceae bacterium]
MKSSAYLPIIVCVLAVSLTGCDRADKATEKRLAELEAQHRAAVERQQDLERQLAEQLLASERDAIERERQRIEDERYAIEQARAEDAAGRLAALEQREQALARREGKLETQETNLFGKELDLMRRETQLSERELEVAGREPLPPAEPLPAAGPAVRRDLPVADYGMFYDSLSPYGSWFLAPGYGYVWQPALVRRAGWRPYWDGRWACTNQGWMWLSNEPFGWAVYHYGRWTLLRAVGWVWVPGYQWGPSWVTWRSGGGYIGWAPLPPETMAWSSGSWGSTVEATFGIGQGWFTFIASTNFCQPVRRHYVPVADYGRFWGGTVNITNIHYQDNRVFVGGPPYKSIRDAHGRHAPYYRLDLERHTRPGRDAMAMRPRFQGDRIAIAAPDVNAGWNAALRPSRVRGEMSDATVDRPQPLAPEVADRFRHHREREMARAEEETARLGGRDGFARRRADELANNQRQAQILARQQAADLTRREGRPTRGQPTPTETGNPVAAQPGTTPGPTPEPDRPSRPQRPGTTPGAALPGEAAPPAGRQPDVATTEAPPGPRPSRQPGQIARPTGADRPQPPTGDAAPANPAPAEPTAPPPAQAQTEDRRRQPAEQDRQRQAAEQAAQQREVAENVRRQQTAEARQQQEEARQRQAAEETAQQREVAESARRKQFEEARQHQEEARQRQAAEQAAQQREAAENARRQQIEEARQQQEEARQRQAA